MCVCVFEFVCVFLLMQVGEIFQKLFKEAVMIKNWLKLNRFLKHVKKIVLKMYLNKNINNEQRQ